MFFCGSGTAKPAWVNKLIFYQILSYSYALKPCGQKLNQDYMHISESNQLEWMLPFAAIEPKEHLSHVENEKVLCICEARVLRILPEIIMTMMMTEFVDNLIIPSLEWWHQWKFNACSSLCIYLYNIKCICLMPVGHFENISISADFLQVWILDLIAHLQWKKLLKHNSIVEQVS